MTVPQGRARASGGITIVNGIAALRGATLAVDLWTEATVMLVEGGATTVEIHPDSTESPDLARLVAEGVLRERGLERFGAAIETRSAIPVSRGLKSSSAAANAIALATDAAASNGDGGVLLPRARLLAIGVDAALKAGVTITGAFDDASASMLGGLCVTDNAKRVLLARFEPPTGVVAVIAVPREKVRKSAAKAIDTRAIAGEARAAHALALRGDAIGAMAINGRAYGRVYLGEVALERQARAVERGALAASVSGTGPAVAALAPDSKAEAVRAVLGEGGEETFIVPLSSKSSEVLPC